MKLATVEWRTYRINGKELPMSRYLLDKVVLVTGAGGGFGRIISQKCAAGGARVVGVDVNADGLKETIESIETAGGTAIGQVADVISMDEMVSASKAAVETYGAVDVLVNNAGTMPLAFFSDHEAAWQKWHRAIDINIKGVVNGISAVYDQMIEQGRGQVVNIGSIYGNAGTQGSGVYSGTKAAVELVSESLRTEAKGAIKVTTVKPTGVFATNLLSGVVNMDAAIGMVGHRAGHYGERLAEFEAGTLPPEYSDSESIKYWMLAPEELAGAVVHVIDQPWGVSLSDVTVRASGDDFII